jgi:hypothetical protein
VLIDDIEDASRNGPAPARLNLWGGNWSISEQAGVTSTASYLAPGAHGSLHSVSWTTKCPANDFANLVSDLPAAFDATGNGFIGLQFWAYGDGRTYRFMIKTQNITDYDYYGVNLTPPVNTWRYYQIPFTSMARQGWGAQSPAPVTVTAGHDITGVQFAIQGSPTLFNLCLDDVGFYQASAVLSPTPSLTRTSSPTISPTPSASPTATITLTPTPCPTASLTYSVSPTPSISPTASATPSVSPSLTPSATLSPSQGSLRVIQARMVPNPVTQAGPATLYVHLSAPAQELRLRLYSQAYTGLGEWTLSGAGAGWSTVSVPEAALPRNGVYYGRLWAKGPGRTSDPKSFIIFVAR